MSGLLQYLAAGAGVRRDVGRTAYLSFSSSVRNRVSLQYSVSYPVLLTGPAQVLCFRVSQGGKEVIGAMLCPYISPSPRAGRISPYLSLPKPVVTIVIFQLAT
jgi:hypothetical protein